MGPFGVRLIDRIVSLGLPLALTALSVAALAVVGARLRVVPPLVAFGIFALALVGGGGMALLLGSIGLFRGGEGRGAALLAAGIGLACIAAVVALAFGARDAPPIHDISTDLEDPPAFDAAARLPANRGRDLSYPNGATDSAARQRRAYPDVTPIRTTLEPARAFEAALRVADELGWRVTARQPERGTFEAEAETPVFRFVDDVVVRVRPREGGAVVDVRSLSRVGVGDMGVNAERIRAFRERFTGS